MTKKYKLIRFLKTELKTRSGNDRSYSMRRFADDLDIDHSFLAKMLSGDRALTPLTVKRIGTALKFDAATEYQYMEDVLKVNLAKREQKPKRVRS